METTTQQQDYTATIIAAVPIEHAFDSIGAVQEWWAKHFEGSARKPGDRFTVRFGTTFVHFLISEYVPNRRIVWHVEDCYLPFQEDKQEWNGTDVVWDLNEANEGVRIRMTHIGLRPEVECYKVCREGWDRHIKDSLLQFIATGQGQPQ